MENESLSLAESLKSKKKLTFSKFSRTKKSQKKVQIQKTLDGAIISQLPLTICIFKKS